MIKFTNNSEKSVMEIESNLNKEVSIILKFGVDTVRFLQAVMDAQQATMQMAKEAYKVKDKLGVDGNIDLEKMTNEELEKLIDIAGNSSNVAKNKMELISELVKLLKIEDIAGELSFGQLNQLYNLVTKEPQNTFPS